MTQKTRVGVRGVTGHFATGLLYRIRKTDDIVASVGIAREDPTLWRTIRAIETAPQGKRKALTEFFPKLMVLESEKNGTREIVETLNKAQDVFKFVPSCDFNPVAECDVIVDVTRGAKNPVEKQYEGFARNNPVIVTLDTGQEESLRGRLIVPPFMEKGRDGKVWRLGDCVASAVSCILTKLTESLKGSVKKIGTTVFCILDSKINDNYILPERAHALYLKASPADLVEKCLKSDMERVFSSCEIETPTIVQAHSLNDYALIVKLSVAEVGISKQNVLGILRGSPHVFIVSEEMGSTFDIDFGLRRLLRLIGEDLPPVVVFSNAVEIEKACNGTNITIRAAVRYADVCPVMCVDAIRTLKAAPIN
ncbi:MAG: hypothetical protein V1909_00675 [Candidatus Micrarchaeota archaeon]